MGNKENGRFVNLDPAVRPQFNKVFQWAVLDRLSGKRRKTPPHAHVDVVQDPEPPSVQDIGAMWLGHATALISIAGLRILTDPVFARNLGLIRRNVPVVLPVEALPHVDVVLISHNHRDHLDRASIKAVEARFKPHFVVPLEVDRHLRAWKVPVQRITTLGWWQDARPIAKAPHLNFTCVPAQHWSQRLIADRNQTLWGGFVLEADGKRVYFAGDSGYFDGFAQIGQRHPNIDLALIPIGAYDPEWFMSPQHMNPDEAGQAFVDLGAKQMISIHWGTYKLTDEPMDEPPRRLSDWMTRVKMEEGRIWTLPVGGRVVL